MGIRSLLRNAFGRSKAARQEQEVADATATPEAAEPAAIPEAREESAPAADRAPAPAATTPETEVPAARTESEPARTEAVYARSASAPASERSAGSTGSTVSDLVSEAFDRPSTTPAPARTPETAAEEKATAEKATDEKATEEPPAKDEAAAEKTADKPTDKVAEDEPAVGTAATTDNEAAAEIPAPAPASTEAEAAKAEAEAAAVEAEAEVAEKAEPRAEATAEKAEAAAATAEKADSEEAATATHSEPDTKLVPEAETEPEAEATPGPKPEAEAEPEVAAEAEKGAEPTAQAEPETKPESAPAATPEPAEKPGAGAPAEPVVTATGTGTTTRSTTPAVSLTKVEDVAPGLVSLYKDAGAALEKQGLTGRRAAVYLVLDRSGSMRNYYKDGTVQHLAEQALGLSANLDDDGTVPVVFFSTDVDGTADIDLTSYEGRIEELHAGLGHMGRTNYHWAIKAVIDHYKKAKTTAPAFVIFQTDGAPTSKPAAEKALCEAADLPIFWQFVGFGDPEAKGFDFLRKLDDLAVPEKRVVDNAGFFHAGRDPRALADTDLFQRLMVEFPEWLNEARAAGILKDS